MISRPPLVFKLADDDWEFEQIHRLNYRTFVEEIPQHRRSPTHRLVDKFHSENTYLICLSGQRLVGMLAVRGSRPFSLDQKVANLDSYLPAGRKICEIRLLAIAKPFRGAQVLQGILALLWQHGVEQGYDLAIISGTTRQSKLYHHLGFVPFGPLVGSPEARFQPMYITLKTFEITAREFLRSSPSRSFQASAVNFLPGPVTVRREVRRAFEQPPESHRGESFLKDFLATKQVLCDLVQTPKVELLLGSGTLANDVVAGQLSLEGTAGLILSNGEFGERLLDHGRRFGLTFEPCEVPWGESFSADVIRRKLEQNLSTRWLWCAHCETSTGVLTDLDLLKDICPKFGVKLCLDCVSSLGTVPLDLKGVYLATGTSGKGLCSYPGVSMVFYHHHPAESARENPVSGESSRDAAKACSGGRRPLLPRYLDLSYYASQQGIPFTFSSNLLHALQAALRHVQWDRRFEVLREGSRWLRPKLREVGFELVGGDNETSPAIVTLALPQRLNSLTVGKLAAEAGYLLSYNSEYLRPRNWIQISLMSECAREKLVSLLNVLNRIRCRLGAPACAGYAVT